MKPIRALVVEDSLTVRRHLVDVLTATDEIAVIGEAEDGRKAIELCERLRPDVVTLDMMLPELDGLAAAEHIMAYCPTPILIVSSSTNRGELFKTYDALAAGAVDVLEKFDCNTFDGHWDQHFIDSVKLVSRVKVITHPRARLRSAKQTALTGRLGSRSTQSRDFRCVAIGASTGGPQALATILKALPSNFPLPLLLVQHISPAFGDAFAAWLDGLSSIPVSAAFEGERLPPVGTGRALLAPPDRHMILRDGRIWLTRAAEVHSCRPSIDVLFESVAAEFATSAIGVQLTGMGRDGAQGLLAIKNAGGRTLAQNEATSVIFGMPRAAILLGAAQQVLPLDEIGPALASLAASMQPEGDGCETADLGR